MEPCGENSCDWCEADLNHRYQTAGCQLVTHMNSVCVSVGNWGGRKALHLGSLFLNICRDKTINSGSSSGSLSCYAATFLQWLKHNSRDYLERAFLFIHAFRSRRTGG